MKKRLAAFTVLCTCIFGICFAQDPWIISSGKITSDHYTGVSVSNGVIGMISSPEPLKVGNVILAGVYDQYGRGRTSNFLSGFNVVDLNLVINSQQINRNNITNFTQEINFKTATFSGSSHLWLKTIVKHLRVLCSFNRITMK